MFHFCTGFVVVPSCSFICFTGCNCLYGSRVKMSHVVPRKKQKPSVECVVRKKKEQKKTENKFWKKVAQLRVDKKNDQFIWCLILMCCVRACVRVSVHKVNRSAVWHKPFCQCVNIVCISFNPINSSISKQHNTALPNKNVTAIS